MVTEAYPTADRVVTQPYCPEIGYDYSILHLPKNRQSPALPLQARHAIAVSGFLLGTRRVFNLANNVVRHNIFINILGKIAINVQGIFDHLGALMYVTYIAAAIRLIVAPQRLVRKMCKLTKNESWGKVFDRSIAALQSTRIICISLAAIFTMIEPYKDAVTNPTLQYILRVASVAAGPLAAVGAVLSLARLIAHARQGWKIYQYTQTFDRLVDQSRKETNYTTLHAFLMNTKPGLIRKAYKIDFTNYHRCLPVAVEHHFNHLYMEDLIPVLRGRLSSTLNHQVLVVLADAIYCVGSALILANVWLSLGNACKGFFGLWLAGNGCYQFWSSRSFAQTLRTT